jgi:hypothetical protein
LNDGVGDDHNGEDSDEDEHDPGAAHGDDTDDSEGFASQKKRSGGSAHALPEWLMDQFKAHVAASGTQNILFSEARSILFA